MPKLKKCVVTIHGVNTVGAWQEEVHRVLEPHFECLPIKYPDYRNLRLTIGAGITYWSIAADVVALIVLALLAYWGVLTLFWAIAILIPTIILLTAAGIWHARLERQRVVEKIRGMIEDALRPADRHPVPHIIAHSMGTYLSMRSLVAFPTMALDRIVLVGGVLPRRFDWPHLKASRRRAFAEVRNEMGEGDRVVWLVGRIGSILPEFGDSGRRGFLGQGWVHTLLGPLGPCASCRPQVPRAWLHNVPLGPEYGHSTHFLRQSHCEDLWLPFLWGFDPEEVLRFRDICLDVQLHKSDGDWIKQELPNRNWARPRGPGQP